MVRLYPCDVKAGSSALELRRASLSQIVQCACESQTQTKTNSECANHVGSMFLECLDSDADVSVVIVRLQWLNQLQNYSRDTSKYSP